MYKEYKKKTKSESEAQSKQLEYYRSLCKQMAELKGELAEVRY